MDSVSEMQTVTASMKVPPKRKGNLAAVTATLEGRRLNESPSEKEGKWNNLVRLLPQLLASMKVPPKRKGNVCR